MDKSDSPTHAFPAEPLTDRESDVLQLMAEDLSNQEIANRLVLALTTVRWHTRQIYSKFGLEEEVGHKRDQAVALAQKWGLLDGHNQDTSTRLRHNLPAASTPFVGRSHELAQLAVLLRDPDVRLITILAPGGMGKTRLGLTVAAQHIDEFTHGVFFVPLAKLASPDQMIYAIAENARFQFAEDSRTPPQQLLDFLGEKQMLLVMDNCEHLLAGIGLVADILAAAPNVRVLATSRERLNLRGETIYTLGGMQYPTANANLSVEQGMSLSAIRLFVQSAARAYPGYELTDSDVSHVVRICEQVQGMPLGIELAAGWIGVLSLSEIVAEIDLSLDILATEQRDMPDRLRSIRAVFNYTWYRLDDHERAIFSRLSIFRGGMSRDAAQQVAGATLHTLTTLLNKALVWRDPETGRYEIHELLRQYAEECLEVRDEAEVTRDAHSQYFAGFLKSWEPALLFGDQMAAIKVISPDFENVRHAWLRAVEREDLTALSQMVWGLWRFKQFNMSLSEVANLFRAGTQVGMGTATQAQVMSNYGMIMSRFSAGNSPEIAASYLHRAIDLARQHDDHFTLAMALGRLSHNLPLHSDPADAYRLLDEALTLARSIKNRGLEAYLHSLQITPALHIELNPAKALEHARRGLGIAQEIGSHFDTGILILYTSTLSNMLGNYQASLETSQLSLAVFRNMNLEARALLALSEQAKAHLALGNYETSVSLFEEAVAGYRNFGFGDFVADCLAWMGNAYVNLGNYQSAHACLDEAEVLIPSDSSRAWPCIQQARLAYRLGDYPRAVKYLQPVSDMLPHLSRVTTIDAMITWGMVKIALGDLLGARAYLGEVVQPGATYIWFLMQGLYAMATLYHTEERFEKAVELAAFVEHHPGTIHEFKVYSGDLLVALHHELSSDMFEMVFERGIQRGLADMLEEVAADLTVRD